jgi:hypothetical protein
MPTRGCTCPSRSPARWPAARRCAIARDGTPSWRPSSSSTRRQTCAGTATALAYDLPVLTRATSSTSRACPASRCSATRSATASARKAATTRGASRHDRPDRVRPDRPGQTPGGHPRRAPLREALAPGTTWRPGRGSGARMPRPARAAPRRRRELQRAAMPRRSRSAHPRPRGTFAQAPRDAWLPPRSCRPATDRSPRRMQRRTTGCWTGRRLRSAGAAQPPAARGAATQAVARSPCRHAGRASRHRDQTRAPPPGTPQRRATDVTCDRSAPRASPWCL